jgi:type I restriction-modification system DNA methylase subunit
VKESMANIIDQLGFNRLVHISGNKRLSDEEFIVAEQARDFEIDSIYFCKDENHSYPALFLKKITEFNEASIKTIAEIQRKAWNYKKVLFLYVYTDTEIRIYNCIKKPIVATPQTDYNNTIKNFELITATVSDTEKLDTLSNLFSAIAIDTGIIWTLEDALRIREKIDIKTRVDKYLVESLIKTTKKLRTDGLDVSLIHKLLLRSLFLLYLEDRGATDKNFYNKINNKASSYFSILDDVGDTYKLFQELEIHFNGSLFEIVGNEEKEIKKSHLQLIKNCFIYGDDGTGQPELFPDWRIFDFKIIQIELLSEIYECFLAEMEPEKKHQTGTFYTPPSLVELILNEKLPIEKNNKKSDVKILDPACGSGVFLVESFKRLIKRYENASGERLSDYGTLKDLLLNNIFGMDINLNALKIAAFSLYLALLENLDPKTLWQNEELPYLINDIDLSPNKQGKNLFRRNTIEKNDMDEEIKYDLVVGNPPFGTKSLLPSTSVYCKKHGFAQERVLPFLHKATIFSPDGDIALIFNAKVLTNNSHPYIKFREWLFNTCYVERIYNFSILRHSPKNYGGQLFNASSSPICILFYRKNTPPNPEKKIVYYAPKTFIKSNVLDGIVIDSYDVNYLPREECRKADTKIWKIAMWGGEGDLDLISRLSFKKTNRVKQFIKRHSIKSGVGFGLLTRDEEKESFISEELANMKYLDADYITRYCIPEQILGSVTKSLKSEKAIFYYKTLYNVQDINKIKKIRHFRRLGDMGAYKAPHVVVKKGLECNKLCAAFIEFDCSFKDGVYGFYSSNSEILKVLMAYFNSKLSTYFIFMTNSSYGIEREQIAKEEFLSIPIAINDGAIKEISDIISGHLKTVAENDLFGDRGTEPSLEISTKIENIIYKSLNLTAKDIAVINDMIDYTLDLFHNREKSHSLHPIKDITPYAGMLCDEINDFLVDRELYVNPTLYEINDETPLGALKLSFQNEKRKRANSDENIDAVLNKINQNLWRKGGCNIYFRKKLNYYDGDDIFIIRPNQKRFWTQSAAINDALEIILECLQGNDKA